MSIYGSNHEQRYDSAIAPDRQSASAERVDSSSVLVAKVNFSEKGCIVERIAPRDERRLNTSYLHIGNGSVLLFIARGSFFFRDRAARRPRA